MRKDGRTVNLAGGWYEVQATRTVELLRALEQREEGTCTAILHFAYVCTFICFSCGIECTTVEKKSL